MVSLELLTGDRPLPIGSEVAGLERREELLEFDVPAGVRVIQGLRLNFARVPAAGSVSMKVEVKEITLTPRGL
jgi:hypothetical protein